MKNYKQSKNEVWITHINILFIIHLNINMFVIKCCGVFLLENEVWFFMHAKILKKIIRPSSILICYSFDLFRGNRTYCTWWRKACPFETNCAVFLLLMLCQETFNVFVYQSLVSLFIVRFMFGCVQREGEIFIWLSVSVKQYNIFSICRWYT